MIISFFLAVSVLSTGFAFRPDNVYDFDTTLSRMLNHDGEVMAGLDYDVQTLESRYSEQGDVPLVTLTDEDQDDSDPRDKGSALRLTHAKVDEFSTIGEATLLRHELIAGSSAEDIERWMNVLDKANGASSRWFYMKLLRVLPTVSEAVDLIDSQNKRRVGKGSVYVRCKHMHSSVTTKRCVSEFKSHFNVRAIEFLEKILGDPEHIGEVDDGEVWDRFATVLFNRWEHFATMCIALLAIFVQQYKRGYAMALTLWVVQFSIVYARSGLLVATVVAVGFIPIALSKYDTSYVNTAVCAIPILAAYIAGVTEQYSVLIGLMFLILLIPLLIAHLIESRAMHVELRFIFQLGYSCFAMTVILGEYGEFQGSWGAEAVRALVHAVTPYSGAPGTLWLRTVLVSSLRVLRALLARNLDPSTCHSVSLAVFLSSVFSYFLVRYALGTAMMPKGKDDDWLGRAVLAVYLGWCTPTFFKSIVEILSGRGFRNNAKAAASLAVVAKCMEIVYAPELFGISMLVIVASFVYKLADERLLMAETLIDASVDAVAIRDINAASWMNVKDLDEYCNASVFMKRDDGGYGVGLACKMGGKAVIMTAAHVIKGCRSVKLSWPSGASMEFNVSDVFNAGAGPDPVVALYSGRDTNVGQYIDFNRVKSPIDDGERAYVVAHPEGHVAFSRNLHFDRDYEDVGIVEVAIKSGDSGSPLLEVRPDGISIIGAVTGGRPSIGRVNASLVDNDVLTAENSQLVSRVRANNVVDDMASVFKDTDVMALRKAGEDLKKLKEGAIDSNAPLDVEAELVQKAIESLTTVVPPGRSWRRVLKGASNIEEFNRARKIFRSSDDLLTAKFIKPMKEKDRLVDFINTFDKVVMAVTGESG